MLHDRPFAYYVSAHLTLLDMFTLIIHRAQKNYYAPRYVFYPSPVTFPFLFIYLLVFEFFNDVGR
jgi:hypothetical protein